MKRKTLDLILRKNIILNKKTNLTENSERYKKYPDMHVSHEHSRPMWPNKNCLTSNQSKPVYIGNGGLYNNSRQPMTSLRLTARAEVQISIRNIGSSDVTPSDQIRLDVLTSCLSTRHTIPWWTPVEKPNDFGIRSPRQFALTLQSCSTEPQTKKSTAIKHYHYHKIQRSGLN